MPEPIHPARPVELTGVLGTVLVASALQFALARVLLLAQGGVSRVGAGTREAMDLGVAATGVVMLVLLYLRARAGRTAPLLRELPASLVVVPPLATLAALPRLEAVIADLPATMHTLVPALGSTIAAGLLMATLVGAAMRALMIRGGLTPPDAVDPPSLPAACARILAAAALVVALVVLGRAFDGPETTALRSELVWMVLGVVALVVIAVVAGAVAGETVGSDPDSLARRLDALGHGSAPAVSPPIVPTELDQLGELLGELERLRARLDHEQRLYQDALERTQAADAAKAEFLSAVSHELRTPLHTVGGYAQLLLSGIPAGLSDAQAEDVRLIQAGGRQLLELVNDILDLSMIESGELRLSFASADVGSLVEEIVRIHQPQVRERGVELRADLAELPDAVCDRRRIGQILTNLVSNAIKFTERGTIVVRADVIHDGHSVAVAVADTGIGIAPDEIGLIFDEYAQAGTISRRKKGTGLGLAIARAIALAHGGSLSVESEPGRGSTFILVLPVDPPRRPATIDIAEQAARAVVRARTRSDSESAVSR
jgi:signal transduction histidine kinase